MNKSATFAEMQTKVLAAEDWATATEGLTEEAFGFLILNYVGDFANAINTNSLQCIDRREEVVGELFVALAVFLGMRGIDIGEPKEVEQPVTPLYLSTCANILLESGEPEYLFAALDYFLQQEGTNVLEIARNVVAEL